MHFKVTHAKYRPERQRLEFTATGEREGVKFTVATHVRCNDPVTPENAHLAALLRIEELFRRRSASGR
jgi:hypothetical protein